MYTRKMLIWVTVNTHIWKCDEAMRMDAIAQRISIPLSICWDQYKLKSDKLHIIESDFERFAKEFSTQQAMWWTQGLRGASLGSFQTFW